MMNDANAAAGRATTSRAPRSEPPPRSRGSRRGRAVEVRPQLLAEDELGVGRLPHEVVAETLLAARADDEVRVVHLGRVQQRAEVLLVAAGEVACGVDDLGTAAVVEGDEQRAG